MKNCILFCLVLFCFNVRADLDWLKSERALGFQVIMQNISPTKAVLNGLVPKRGSIVASTTPHYYYHWTRDAGLVVDSLLQYYEASASPAEKAHIAVKLAEYREFSEYIQNVYTDERFGPAILNLGEPKFNVDGSAFNENWGRPQNDGPALRAISLIHWSKILMAEGQEDYVRFKIYKPTLPADSVLKKDLEYISHHWRDPDFEPWEEVKGEHFYNRMVQRRALLEGAELASLLGDAAAAAWYYTQAREIEATIPLFWSPRRGYFMATRNRVGGHDYKHSHLDASVLLGLLHGGLNDGFLPLSDPKVLATVEKLAEAFIQVYEVNQQGPGIAIGRYPEDRYEGGNPWVLTTLAMAEYYYKIGQTEKGDAFVERVKYHAHPGGNLNEQIDRNSGHMKSVEDLTWNYAAIITTFLARSRK